MCEFSAKFHRLNCPVKDSWFTKSVVFSDWDKVSGKSRPLDKVLDFFPIPPRDADRVNFSVLVLGEENNMALAGKDRGPPRRFCQPVCVCVFFFVSVKAITTKQGIIRCGRKNFVAQSNLESSQLKRGDGTPSPIGNNDYQWGKASHPSLKLTGC